MRLIISPRGTSVLTNYIRNYKIYFNACKYANLKEDKYEPVVLEGLTSRKNPFSGNWHKGLLRKLKKASAELNGLLPFDENVRNPDLLFFIVTDMLPSKITFAHGNGLKAKLSPIL